MNFVEEAPHVLAKLREDLAVLEYQERKRPFVSGYVVATNELSAVKAGPGGKGLVLHGPEIKGMHIFRTRSEADDIVRIWNDDVEAHGLGEHLRVRVMTRMDHLAGLLPLTRRTIDLVEQTLRTMPPGSGA